MSRAGLSDTLRKDTAGADGQVKAAIIMMMIVASTVAAYWGVWNYGFVNFDDTQYVTENRHVKGGLSWEGVRWAFTSFGASNWHPLTWLSHMLDVQVFGLRAGGHHIVNLVLHIMNTLLLLGFLRYTTKRLWPSVFVAALFALHPLHVESVAWIAERKDVLSTFFWMATMWMYAFYVRKPGVPRYLGVMALFALGLMSKPMLVTLPLVLLLLDYWPLERFESIKRLALEKVPLVLLSLGACLVTLSAQRGAMPSSEMIDLPSRFTSAIVSYWRYAWEMIWPQGLAALYPHPRRPLYGEAAAVLLLLAAGTAIVLSIGKKHRYVVVGWFWYIITLIPVLGLVQVGLQSHADRYTYIPLTGLFIIVAWWGWEMVSRHPRMKIGAAVVAAGVLCILGVLSWRTAGFWKDDLTLFGRATAVTKDNYRMMANLGVRLTENGELDKGLVLLEKSLALRSDDATTLNGLGVVMRRMGRYQEAEKRFGEVLAIEPKFDKALFSMGLTLVSLGRNDEAVDYFRRATEVRPDWALAYSYLGQTLGNAGRPDEGMGPLKHAIELEPGLADAHYGLGGIYLRKGDLASAAAEYRIAGELAPEAKAFSNLGACLMGMGRRKEAEEAYRKAVAIEPNSGVAHADLATVLEALGRRDEAVAEVKKAMELEPQNPDVQARYRYFKGGQK